MVFLFKYTIKFLYHSLLAMDQVLQERKQELQQRIWNLDTFLVNAFDIKVHRLTEEDHKRAFLEFERRRRALECEMLKFARVLYETRK